MRLICLILLVSAALSACSTIGGGLESVGNWIHNTADDWKQKT